MAEEQLRTPNWLPWGLLGAGGLLAALAWLLWPAPVSEELPTPALVEDSPAPVPQARRIASPPPPSVPAAPAEAPMETRAPPLPDARASFLQRLAALRGDLHVRCYVGEEYDATDGRACGTWGCEDNAVRDGWVSFNTPERSGSRNLGFFLDAQIEVSWDAPEDATEATCEVQEPTWAQIVVHVKDEAGAPLEGAAIVGCGVAYETREDGRAEFPVLVTRDPCILDVMRARGGVYHQGYVRVAPLHSDEERTYRVTAEAFDERVTLDHVALLAGEDQPTTGVPPLAAPTPGPTLEEYEDHLEDARAHHTHLLQVLSETPEAEQWYAEESIEKHAEHIARTVERIRDLEEAGEAPAQ